MNARQENDVFVLEASAETGMQAQEIRSRLEPLFTIHFEEGPDTLAPDYEKRAASKDTMAA